MRPETIRALIDKMKAEKKVLPFFVLDDMSPNENIEYGGMKTAASQRNVFSGCGLVVIVMGTAPRSRTYGARKYQLRFAIQMDGACSGISQLSNNAEYVGRETNVAKAFGEISRCARHFDAFSWTIREVFHGTNSGMRDPIKRDRAFPYARQSLCTFCLKTHEGKAFLKSREGKFAQLIAISHTNAVVCRQNEVGPPRKKS